MKRLALLLWFVAATAAAAPIPVAVEPEPVAAPVAAEPAVVPCPEGAVCIPQDEMRDTFIPLLQAHKCRAETEPTFELDSVNIITDRQGRVYFSGNGPKPYKLKMDWCNYEVEAEAEVKVHVAQREEPTWGFRPRFKATFGILFTELLERDLESSLDGGLLFEPFFWNFLNLNAYVGVRSFGAGVGVDITTNFGGYAGVALTWGSWRTNPMASLFFSF